MQMTQLIRSGLKSVSGFINILSTFFDGIDDYANADPIVSALSGTTKGTWTGRVKPVDSSPDTIESFFALGDTNANEVVYAHITANGFFRVSLNIAGTAQWQLTTTAKAFTDDTWTHWGLVFDGVEAKLYIDAVLVAQFFDGPDTDRTKWIDSMPGLDNARISALNFLNLGNGNEFNGKQDEPRIWKTDLSAAQMVTTFNGGPALDPAVEPEQADLVTNWRMGDGDVDPTLTDSTGGNSATLVNGPTFVADVQT